MSCAGTADTVAGAGLAAAAGVARVAVAGSSSAAVGAWGRMCSRGGLRTKNEAIAAPLGDRHTPADRVGAAGLAEATKVFRPR